MGVTSNIYQRIHALSKADFRAMRADLKPLDSYHNIISGKSQDVSAEEKAELRRIFERHRILIATDDEAITAVFVTMGRAAAMR